MPIDQEKWDAPASAGEVAAVAISVAVCMTNVVNCLYALSEKEELPLDSVKRLKAEIEWLDKEFDRLSGYTAEAEK